MRRRLRGLALAAVGAAAVFGLSFPTHAADPAKVAFLRLTSGFWQVWEMAPDGSSPRQLTRTPVDKVMAAWRPGADALLYHTQRGETFLLDTAAGREERILEGLLVTDAAWSLDGRTLAYGLPPEDLVGGKTTLWVSSPGGDDRRQVAGENGVDALAPSWLPDGSSLLYRECRMKSPIAVDHTFWVLKPGEKATECQVPGDDEPLKFDQAVSAQGVIAYSSNRGGHYEIWTLDPGRGAPRQVTRLGSYAGNPTWSPDGGWIAFDSDHEGEVQVYKVRADGSDLTRLTTGEAPSRKPAWEGQAAGAGGPERDWCQAGPAVAEGKGSGEAPPPPEGGGNGAPIDRRPPPAKEQAPGALSISWVSLDRPSFDPGRDEHATLRFHLSGPARFEVRFLDGDGRVVRRVAREATAGDQQVAWDGRDEKGEIVPPDAYAYTIAAAGAGGEVSYDLRSQTEGEEVWPRNPVVDPASGKVRYTLPGPSRVRLVLIRKDTVCPLLTLLDWAPREEGPHEEPWDGWDESHTTRYLGAGGPPLLPLLYAFSLPKNTIIVKGSGKAPAAGSAQGRAAARTGDALPTGRELYLHAKHPRSICYDPRLSLSLPEVKERTDGGLPRVTRPTPLRIEPAAEQGPGHEPPLPRMSVFVYADGVMVERCLSGYVPYQWIVDPEKLGPGEHVITALLGWRDDHLGIAQIKLRVDPAEPGGGK